jgi:2-polyprenyl-3-methyl-5-hydroxy-6-metoxy-1,4-benzoquinol methylase
MQKVGFALEQSRYVSAKMVEKVLPYASDGIWLDVGFGNGSLLFTAQEYGFKPVGIDLRPDTVSEMKSFGIDAHCIDLCELSTNEQVSVISMADVLEHIPYPKTALHAAKNLLKDGGILLVSMPNFENAVWEELDQKNQNPYWGEIEHFHNFGRARLYSLLSECGYSPARYGVSERYRCCMEVLAIKN